VSSSSVSSSSSSAPSSSSSSIASSSSVASSSSSSGAQGFVTAHGQLRTSGNQLVDKNGASVQLRGMSSHGLQWYGNYMNLSSIRWLRDDWKINVIRAAMYTEEEGYLEDPSVKNKVFEMIDAAIALDIYVIVDWHILYDGNPQTHKAQAKAFFNEVAQRYGNIPNVIYEIANEPNGGGVNWNSAIRPYAQEVIPVIRNHAPNSFVIVGTGNWSQDVTDAASNPVSYPNVAYAMHFYACTHGQWLRDRVDQARAQGAVIFSTVWGTADASGDGSVCEHETRTWINFLNQRGISWANWSLATKAEATAALRGGASTSGNWNSSDLTTSGTLVRTLLRQ
jgi:endoglucanase